MKTIYKHFKTFLSAFIGIFDLTGGNYKPVKTEISEIEKGPHLVYSDFELVGMDMQKAIKDLNLK